MTEVLIFYFWFITMPIAAIDNATDYGPYGIFPALLEGLVIFVGGLVGWFLLGPASPLFNVIALAVAYLFGLAVTRSLYGDDGSTVKWGVILFLSGFILQKVVFWLVLIY